MVHRRNILLHSACVADQNPNRTGAELVLEAYSIFDEGAELLKKALESGSVKTLLMAGSDYSNPDAAWLAALAIESGCEFVTTDRDFARFPGLRWRHPLEGA